MERIANRYVLREAPRKGSSGAVSLAFDEQLERDVALKLIQRTSGEAAERVLREARAIAGIDHANVVRIFDYGEHAGRLFIVMEWLGNRNLRQVMVEGVSAIEERIVWLREIAAGLLAAHDKGVIHRDVKPENVVIAPDGRAKLVDFGLVRSMTKAVDRAAITATIDPRASPKSSTHVGALTRAGWVVGTPQYMAPEQLRGEPLDARTDQFAWGVLAYELLSGRRPWEGAATVHGIADALFVEAVPLTDVARAVPLRVSRAVMRALAKTPSDRFPSLEEIVAALSVETPTTRETPRRLRGHRWGVWAIVAATAGLTLRHDGQSAALREDVPAVAPTAVRHETEASLRFAAGRQAQRDASKAAAVREFESAVDSDPTLAAAHVWWIITMGFIDDEAEGHFRAAVSLRARLDSNDQALLDALEPRFRRPVDAKLSNERFARLALDQPTSADMQFVLAKFQFLAGDYRTAIESAERALRLDPAYADARRILGLAKMFDGRVEEGLADISLCAESSPSGDTCLLHLYEAYANEGMCAEAERVVRTLISHDPSNDRWYLTLASALWGTGHSTSVVRASLNDWNERARTKKPRLLMARMAQLAVLEGDFRAAETFGNEWLADAGSSAIEDDHFMPMLFNATLMLEAGRKREAGDIAERFLRMKSGWMPETYDIDPTIFMVDVEFRTGRIAEPELLASRDAWLAAEGARVGTERGNAWVWGYALTAATPRAAEEAVANLPAYRPLPDPVTRRANFDSAIGEAFLRAGHFEEALPALRRAATSCRGSEYPFEVVGANVSLGDALLQGGKTADACRAWRKVIDAWGSGASRSVSAKRAKERFSLYCQSVDVQPSAKTPRR